MLMSKTRGSSLTNDKVKKIRMECTKGYYRYLTHLNTDESVDEDTPLDSIDSNQDICRNANYTIDISYNIMCQVMVFCDIFGCFDINLKEFNMSKTMGYNNTAEYYCSSCSDECWLISEFLAWEDTETTMDEVIRVFNNSHSPDFFDVMAIYTPNDRNIENFTVEPKDFINICSHDQRPCSYRQFHEWVSDRYGMCYTYNSVFRKVQLKNKTEIKAPLKKTSLVGPTNGLRLTVNIHKDKYLALLSQEVGLRVIVHSPYQLPFPEDEGFNVSPGFINSIKVSRTKLERVGPPHGTCQSESDSANFTEYSSIRCKKMCVEREIWRTCQCYQGSNPAYESKSPPKPAEPCNQFNISQKLCMDIALFSYQRGILTCDCPPACSETVYESQVTTSAENKEFYTIIQDRLKRKMGDDLCGNETGTVRIHLYLDSLSYQSIQESPSLSWDTLVSNFGGNLGLFIGMSLVTIAEILEFLVDLVLLGVESRQRRKASSVTTVTPIQSITSNSTPASQPGNSNGIKRLITATITFTVVSGMSCDFKPSLEMLQETLYNVQEAMSHSEEEKPVIPPVEGPEAAKWEEYFRCL
nr:degenerin unc-8-like [Procambarus clarkii]